MFAQVHNRVVAEQSARLIQELYDEATKGLSPQDKNIIKMRFGLNVPRPLSVRQVASATGMPKSTVYDRERRALAQLKTSHPHTNHPI